MINHPNRKIYASTKAANGRAYRIVRWDGEYVVQQHVSGDTWTLGAGHHTLAAAEADMRAWAQSGSE